MYPDFETAQTRFHRYRIQVIEGWPESPLKQSALAAAHGALEREIAQARISACARCARSSASFTLREKYTL
jgi:hypothetical protein